jgi:hypothetical protein
MSSRALRKAQQQREKLQQIDSIEQSEHEDVEETVPFRQVKKSAFDLLGEASDEVDDAETREESDLEAADPTVHTIEAGTADRTSSKKKKTKKKKGKGKGGANTRPSEDLRPPADDEELDEIDTALKELSTDGNGSQPASTAAGESEEVNEMQTLLAIDIHHLHVANEVRLLFGRTALEQEQAGGEDNAHQGNRRQARRQQVGVAQAVRGMGAQGGRSAGLTAMALKRNIFIQGKQEWPHATGGGLGMEVEEKRPDGTIIFRFVHNSSYQDVQAQFEMAVQSMDPNRLIVLLQHNPYHISTLLQVSEIAKHERDHTTSGDLLERALFSLGRAVHSTFAKNLEAGKARLDFRRAENREFWLAGWRYIQNLSMRGTWRTVYTWAKLLLSLCPDEDPYSMWSVLDQYALRARQDLDFLNLSRNTQMKAVHSDIPNVQLSQALGEARAGNKSKGQQALYTAIGRFPWVTVRLMQELQLDPPPAIWGAQPRTDREKLECELYATRAKDLWNTPEASALLLETASALPPDTPSAPINDREITQNEARHVLLSDTPALIALLPRSYTKMIQSASDPLPPSEGFPSYLSGRQRSSNRPQIGSSQSVADNLRELHGLYGFFSNLFPWFNSNGALEPRDGAEPGDGEPTPEEVERRIRESGVDEELIVQRTARMVQLQHQLRGELEDGAFDRAEVEAATTVVDDGNRQARVEDVDDTGD